MVAGSSRFPAVRASVGSGRRCVAAGVGGFGIWVAQRQQPAAARCRVAIELFEMAVAEIERLQRPAEPTRPSAGHSPRLRSEEHTSALQSLLRITSAVLCLKKKTKNTSKPHQQTYKLNLPRQQQ